MPTVYPLLGEPYQISDREEAELERQFGSVRKATLARDNSSEQLHEALLEEAMQARFEKIEADARTAAAQPALDLVDATFGRALKTELAAENATARVTELQRKHFAAFKAAAEKWQLPYLPAAPQMVTLFLSENCDRGSRHVNRLCQS